MTMSGRGSGSLVPSWKHALGMLLALQTSAVIITALSWLPQWWRTVQHSSRGLSSSAWAQATTLAATWTLWGTQAHVWSMAISEGAFTIGGLLVLSNVLTRSRQVQFAAVALATATTAAVCLPAYWLGLAGVIGSAVIRLTQIQAMLRAGTSDGVSVTTWTLLAISGTAWGAVGILVDQPLLVAGAATGLTTTALVAVAANRASSTIPRTF